MPSSSFPSYLRNQVNSDNLPQGLIDEQEDWTMHPDLVLSGPSAQALVEAYLAAERFFQSELFARLEVPDHEGVRALKNHGTRVAVLSLFIAEQINISRGSLTIDIRNMAMAALLHDCAKWLPHILPFVLSPEKFEKGSPEGEKAWRAFRRHAKAGGGILAKNNGVGILGEDADFRNTIALTVAQHHERPDGNGYYQVPSSKLTPEAYVLIAADSADAMLDPNRVYNRAKTIDEVVKEMRELPGQFHPQVTNSFLTIIPGSGLLLNHKQLIER